MNETQNGDYPVFKIILVLGTAVGLVISAPYSNAALPTASTMSPPAVAQPRITVVPLGTTTTSTTVLPLDDVDWVALARATYGKCGEWYDTAMSAGWPKDQWPTISKVMWRESRCTPDAWNGQDAGLLQINRVHKKYLVDMGLVFPSAMFNPYLNLYYARTLWERAGWEPWKFRGVVPGE